jgi:hypothetical protein
MNRASWLRCCCLSGLLGSLLFLAGDMLFYGSWSSGADFHPYQQMAQRSTEVLVLGGAIGPVAALFSALGMGMFALTLEPAGRKLADTVAILLAIMILIGASYHAIYTCLGFASKLADPTWRDTMLAQVTDLRTTISYPMYAAGLTATAMVYWLALARKALFPRWLLLFLPTTLSLLASPLHDVFVKIPAPLGSIIRGGWINGSFVLFFTIATLVFWHPRLTLND